MANSFIPKILNKASMFQKCKGGFLGISLQSASGINPVSSFNNVLRKVTISTFVLILNTYGAAVNKYCKKDK
jgi:hypothetical protein